MTFSHCKQSVPSCLLSFALFLPRELKRIPFPWLTQSSCPYRLACKSLGKMRSLFTVFLLFCTSSHVKFTLVNFHWQLHLFPPTSSQRQIPAVSSQCLNVHYLQRKGPDSQPSYQGPSDRDEEGWDDSELEQIDKVLRRK